MAKEISTNTKTRRIIKEFAKEVEKRKVSTGEKTIIPFRDDKKKNFKREVYLMPLDLLYFRKDNGRIASDVLTYEVIYGELDETSDFGQARLKDFLEMKDKEKTIELRNSIKLNGQAEAAVITSDGFLINGNRRKLVLQSLLQTEKSKDDWKYLRVVILPNESDSEPIPTINEIEQLENRYQFQTLGKAEYYNFDKALSIRRKIAHGMSLKEQLMDDPNYATLSSDNFSKAVKNFEQEYLAPLECIDRYLLHFGKAGQYNSVSTGYSDREGRWQAFLDYYKSVYKKLSSPTQRMNLNIEIAEIELIEDIAFKIIRKRDIEGVGKKVHQIMRDFPKLLSNENSRNELFELADVVKAQLAQEESVDKYGKPLDGKTIDLIWDSRYGKEIDFHVSKAYYYYLNKKTEEAALVLIKESLSKLNDKKIERNEMSTSSTKEAIVYLNEIESRVLSLIKILQSQIRSKRKKSTKNISPVKTGKK